MLGTCGTTTETFLFAIDSLVSASVGTAVGAVFHVAIPPDLPWVRAGTVWIPMILIGLIHGCPVIASRRCGDSKYQEMSLKKQ